MPKCKHRSRDLETKEARGKRATVNGIVLPERIPIPLKKALMEPNDKALH